MVSYIYNVYVVVIKSSFSGLITLFSVSPCRPLFCICRLDTSPLGNNNQLYALIVRSVFCLRKNMRESLSGEPTASPSYFYLECPASAGTGVTILCVSDVVVRLLQSYTLINNSPRENVDLSCEESLNLTRLRRIETVVGIVNRCTETSDLLDINLVNVVTYQS